MKLLVFYFILPPSNIFKYLIKKKWLMKVFLKKINKKIIFIDSLVYKLINLSFQKNNI